MNAAFNYVKNETSAHTIFIRFHRDYTINDINFEKFFLSSPETELVENARLDSFARRFRGA